MTNRQFLTNALLDLFLDARTANRLTTGPMRSGLGFEAFTFLEKAQELLTIRQTQPALDSTALPLIVAPWLMPFRSSASIAESIPPGRVGGTEMSFVTVPRNQAAGCAAAG